MAKLSGFAASGRLWPALVASVGGIGFIPIAAGTFGALAGVVLGALLLAEARVLVAGAAIAAAGGGLWAVRRAGADDDPGWVVIDEVAGQLLAVLALPRPAFGGLAAAFLLFRLFDVSKWGPVGWADRHHGPVGVIGDDLIAGALAAAVLLLWGTVAPAFLDWGGL